MSKRERRRRKKRKKKKGKKKKEQKTSPTAQDIKQYTLDLQKYYQYEVEKKKPTLRSQYTV